MSIKDACVGFASKYGPYAKVVASAVLNVVAPGSAALINITDAAIEATKGIADNIEHKKWEELLLARVDQTQEDVQRVAEILGILNGPLSDVCDRAKTFAKDEGVLAHEIRRAIAEDPSLSNSLHRIDALRNEFRVVQQEVRRIARNQEEVKPVFQRMNRIADYFDELWDQGVKPRDLAKFVSKHAVVTNKIKLGKTEDADREIAQLRKLSPAVASLDILEAASATRDFDYLHAQKNLANAVSHRPDDRELSRLAKRLTVMATESRLSSKSETTSPIQRAGGLRLNPGDDIDGWTLVQKRGAGGWGQVFKASREDEVRAIKIMHPELAADKKFLQRFKKEIASLWQLPNHKNLLSIDSPEKSFGFCIEHQTWYLVMEFVDGPTLESYLAKNGSLSESIVKQVFLGLIDGLAEAHSAGFVHRDIKPANMIFRKSDRQLVLVDFGLAVAEQDLGKTNVGGISVQFAAPEQHYGDSATKSSDVFSVCASMLYALCYDAPEQRTPNGFAKENVPEALSELLERGLAMNPNKRFLDANEMLAAFRRTKNNSSVPIVNPVQEEVIEADFVPTTPGSDDKSDGQQMFVPPKLDSPSNPPSSPSIPPKVPPRSVPPTPPALANQNKGEDRESSTSSLRPNPPATDLNPPAKSTHRGQKPPTEPQQEHALKTALTGPPNESADLPTEKREKFASGVLQTRPSENSVPLPSAPQKEDPGSDQPRRKGLFVGLGALGIVGALFAVWLVFFSGGSDKSSGGEDGVKSTAKRIESSQKRKESPPKSRLVTELENAIKARDGDAKESLQWMMAFVQNEEMRNEIGEKDGKKRDEYFKGWLNISGKELTEIADEIRLIKDVQRLDLSRNKLTKFPDGMFELRKISKLEAAYNDLVAIQPEISNFAKLIELDLKYNELATVPKEIGALENLKKLHLEGNRGTFSDKTKAFEGFSLPREVGALSNLELLSVSPKNIPVELWSLPKLTILRIEGKDLSAIPPGITALKRLRLLTIDWYQARTLPADVWKLTELWELELQHGMLETVPAEVGNLTQLRQLHVGSMLQSVSPEIGKLNRLEELTLIGRYRLKTVPDEIGGLTKIKKLEIGDQLESLPRNLGNLKDLKSLEIKFAKGFLESQKDAIEALKKKLPNCKMEFSESS